MGRARWLVTFGALVGLGQACSSTNTNEAPAGGGGTSAGSGGSTGGSGGAAGGSGGAAAGSGGAAGGGGGATGGGGGATGGGGGAPGGSGGAVGLDGGQDATLDVTPINCHSNQETPVCASNDASTGLCPEPYSNSAEFLCVDPATGNAEVKIVGTNKLYWCSMATGQPTAQTCKKTAVKSTHLITSDDSPTSCACGTSYTMGFPFCTWLCKAVN